MDLDFKNLSPEKEKLLREVLTSYVYFHENQTSCQVPLNPTKGDPTYFVWCLPAFLMNSSNLRNETPCQPFSFAFAHKIRLAFRRISPRFRFAASRNTMSRCVLLFLTLPNLLAKSDSYFSDIGKMPSPTYLASALLNSFKSFSVSSSLRKTSGLPFNVARVVHGYR
jgi:hypothetical protein